jgi:hypothetical protein
MRFGTILKDWQLNPACPVEAIELAVSTLGGRLPVILGGDPVDPKNKTWLTRQQHIEAVRYWNRVIRHLRDAQVK